MFSSTVGEWVLLCSDCFTDGSVCRASLNCHCGSLPLNSSVFQISVESAVDVEVI